jgi:selenocysteine lyase/cysteine desulfurase
MYLFSLYKVFGPHQGLLYVRAEVQEELEPQCHFFLRRDPAKRFNPAGPQHAQVAGCAGVLDYFDALAAHHHIDRSLPAPERLAQLQSLTGAHERALAVPLLDFLSGRADIRLLGRPVADGRSATISFVARGRSASSLAAALQAMNIGVEAGHFYAHRLLQAVGIAPESGVLRISLVHYNSGEDVQRILEALQRALAG